MRKLIISEIQRIAAENGGRAPGVAAFASATGIREGKWRGVYWARWGDALVEAGFQANTLVSRRDSNEILRKVAELCRILGRMPTNSEMMLRVQEDPSFPNRKTVASHFGGISGVVAALRTLALSAEYADIAPLLPEPKEPAANSATPVASDGVVYLLKSGQHYKIGRSDQIERRIKEISVALPESTTLVHSIRTDDPVGIETYWHKRFADRRANGEWFRLTPQDVKAFFRRKFM
jgi:hypothetical protein